jgi:aminoglycoside 6'-N-acetyltransferase I
MKIDLTLTDITNSYIIKNFYPLYLHDLARFNGTVPNHHGIFEENDTIVTLAEQYNCQNAWWENPDSLFPYLILVDSIPAGFALISSPPYCCNDADYTVHEYFIVNAFRGKGIGKAAALIVFEKHKGKWALHTNASVKNQIAQLFWHNLINNYMTGEFTELVEQTSEGLRVFYRFCNLTSD